MHLLTIVWTLICATIIVAYPVYVFNKSKKNTPKIKLDNITSRIHSHILELVSVNLGNTLTGWSFAVDLPQITEETLKYPILFYLETDETCMKLPLNNATMGYRAEVFKNVGKVYLTFKCLKDGVSNYHIPKSHLQKLKVLILKPKFPKEGNNLNLSKATLHRLLKENNTNINNYEDTLIYLSNMADIDFKGHKKHIIKLSERMPLPSAV